MRVKVRSIEPPAEGQDLEEIVALAGPAADPGAPDGAGPSLRLPATAELGPNGVQVLALLERAARISPDEAGRLEEAAGWRWWSMSPLPGTTVAAARANALVRGRRDGRAEAIVALEAAVQALVNRRHATLGRGSRLPACIANAGLAILVRDLVEPEVFEKLVGPWQEVMHH